jgi:hypothetical protein
MGLSMKERYARLDLGKLPKSYKAEFDEMFAGTAGFEDEDLNDIFYENFDEMYGLVEKNYPDAIKTGGTIKKVKPAKIKVVKAKEEKAEPQKPKNGKKEKKAETVKTRDGVEIKRKDEKNEGKTFYSEDGQAWICKGYNEKADECLFENKESGKQVFSCLESMYVSDPVKKREKGDLVDQCKQTLKDAGFKVIEHKSGTKKIKRSAPRAEKVIIKERVGETFTPIMKDLVSSKEKEEENKELIEVLNNIQSYFAKFMGRISNLADDGKLAQLKKIEKLLEDLVE